MSHSCHQKKVIIAGVPYSSNVGDGVISDCLVDILSKLKPLNPVHRLDIAGRVAYEHKDRGRRLQLLNRLGAFPGWLRRLVVLGGLVALYNLKWKKRWVADLDGGAFLLVGGGQLISDVDLNFPVKIYGLVRVAEKVGLPVGFVCCGVGEHWSFLGKVLIRRALKSKVVKFVSVRDARSVELMRELLGSSKDSFSSLGVKLIPDPAVFCGESSKATDGRAKKGDRVVLGLGVSSPSLLSYSSKSAAGDDGGWHEAFQNVIKVALSNGWLVRVFSNGAPEDEIYIDGLISLYANCESVERVASPVCGDDLIATIRGVDLVVAHRLHANIVAYGLGVPSIGLAWDEKLKSFFRLTNRLDYFVEGPEFVVGNIDSMMKKALSSGVSQNDIIRLKEEVYSGLESAVESLCK